jgi:hypothetical protein
MLAGIAGISLAYDLSVGLVLLVAPGTLASWFGAPLPDPILFVRLNAVFLIAVGLGYLQPLRNPDGHRAYMWIFGVFLKLAGSTIFIVEYSGGGAPASFLVFAASDGLLGLATLAALRLDARKPGHPPSREAWADHRSLGGGG